MKKIVLLVLSFSFVLLSGAQTSANSKKYPSLFWEITGNGLSRPSYLFGTMHILCASDASLSDSLKAAIASWTSLRSRNGRSVAMTAASAGLAARQSSGSPRKVLKLAVTFGWWRGSSNFQAQRVQRRKT